MRRKPVARENYVQHFNRAQGLKCVEFFFFEVKNKFLLWLSMLRTRRCENSVLIPGLTWWVKVSALLQVALQVTDVARIWCCCGSGIGWQLQLLLDSQPGNLHMPWVQPYKDKRQQQKDFYSITTYKVCKKYRYSIVYVKFIKKYRKKEKKKEKTVSFPLSNLK